jgi:RNA-directed DNA polymerase
MDLPQRRTRLSAWADRHSTAPSLQEGPAHLSCAEYFTTDARILCPVNPGEFPFERYADDAICHCQSAKEARALWSALADRLAVCKLVLHPVKTKIVYCKDANRRGDFPIISFDFLGFQFRARKTIWNGKAAHGFMPAASPKALTAISRTVRRWSLHHRSDKSLQELAEMYNPCIRGWITYYSHFYKTRLRPTLKRIDAYVIRWARRKFKRMRHQTKGARDWFDRLHRANPQLFAHWPLCHGNGRTSGAV